MTREDEKQLERMIEVIARAIPKERDAARLYRDTAKLAQSEMPRMLFDKLASQEEEHEVKLRSALEILRRELAEVRAHKGQPPSELPAPHEFNVNIRRTLRLSKDMKTLAEQGLHDANDPSCEEMYTLMQEMAVKLHDLADREAGKHIDKDKWD